MEPPASWLGFGRDENPQVTRFDFLLIYAISTGAGDQAYILVKRCSVMSNNVFV